MLSSPESRFQGCGPAASRESYGTIARNTMSMGTRHRETERCAGFLINDQLEFGGLHDRQIGRLLR
jgi:hypothetical protein